MIFAGGGGPGGAAGDNNFPATGGNGAVARAT